MTNYIPRSEGTSTLKIAGGQENISQTKMVRKWNNEQGFYEYELKEKVLYFPRGFGYGDGVFGQGKYKSTGEVFVDKKKNGKDRGWKERKLAADKLGHTYMRLGLIKRAERVFACASFLEYLNNPQTGEKKLVKAMFCHDPLCDICNWRRSDILRAQVLDVLDVATNEDRFNGLFDGKMEYMDLEFISLTLTIQNVFGGEELKKAIKELHRGFSNMTKLKAFGVFVGYLRTTEVTRNNKKYSEWYGSYHPHIHVLLAVPKGLYFHGLDYLNKDKWIKMWQDVMGLDYAPSIDVQAVTAKRAGQTYQAAVVETAKYAVKSADYLHKDEKVTDTVVGDFLEGMKGVRRVGWGGLFKKIKKELKLQDIESKKADLVGADGEDGNVHDGWERIYVAWVRGQDPNYYKVVKDVDQCDDKVHWWQRE